MSSRVGPNRGGAFEKWAVRLLLPGLVIALLLAFATGFRDRPLVDWRAWFDGPERGTWRALTLNGDDVFADRFLISIAEGEILSGRDGCNYWWSDRDGNGMSTLALCEPTEAMATYAMLAHGQSTMALAGKDRLVLKLGKCRGEFRRWTRDDEEAERAREEADMAAQRQVEERLARNQPQPTQVPPPAPVPPAATPMPPQVPPPPPPVADPPPLPDC